MQKYTTSTNGLLAGWAGTGTYLTGAIGPVGVINTWTLAKGELSEIAIQATFSTSTVYPRYLLQAGSTLPPGLTLYRDGTIGGRIEQSYGANNTRYRFTATVVDSNNNTIVNPGTFDIILINTTATNDHTTLFCKPLLSQQKRREFNDFINNSDIFIPNMIYRKFDPNFGVQKELKLVIFYELTKSVYEFYFNGIIPISKAKLSLSIGSINTAISKNSNGDITSEVIYLNVIDKHTLNSRVSVPAVIQINGITYTPPSIINIRSILPGGNRATIRQPAWSKTIQPDTSTAPEYAYAIPLCFTLPGKSATILRKIEESGFKFNNINYEIDRFIIESVFNEVGNKYVALPRDSKLA
jgi:hypothetical protein